MKTLSICIPTYNRLGYLRELLASMLAQIDALDSDAVELIVSDNVSTDGTGVYCSSIQRPYFRFWTNELNIGGDRNFLKCITEAQGKYVWLVGDDDVVSDGAILKVLTILHETDPELLVLGVSCCGEQAIFSSYGDFLAEVCRDDCGAALNHTLISANVFRRTHFDLNYAEKKLYTQYSHMFGIMKNLNGRVVVASGLVEVRPVRAEFAKYPSCLCVKQAIYLGYLAVRFNQPRFRRFAFVNACNLPIEFAARIRNRLRWCFQKIKRVLVWKEIDNG